MWTLKIVQFGTVYAFSSNATKNNINADFFHLTGDINLLLYSETTDIEY